MKLIFSMLLVLAIIGTCKAQTDTVLSTGHIIYDDARLEQLIPRSAKLEIIGSGFGHAEGPVWYKDSSELLFSDTRAAVIYRWSAAKGLSKFLVHSGFTGRLPYSEEPGSNGLAISKNGELLMCEHGDRRVASFILNGKYGKHTLTDNFQGKRFNSPNDIIIKADGSYYITDPSYGLPHKDTDATRELSFNGVYRLTPEGKTTLLISDIPYPNGLAFSPDEKFFYLTNSDENNSTITRYPVKTDGTLSAGNLFFNAAVLPKNQQKQKVDGLKIDILVTFGQPHRAVWLS